MVEIAVDDLAVGLAEHDAFEPQLAVLRVGEPRPGLLLAELDNLALDAGDADACAERDLLGDADARADAEPLGHGAGLGSGCGWCGHRQGV